LRPKGFNLPEDQPKGGEVITFGCKLAFDGFFQVVNASMDRYLDFNYRRSVGDEAP
jgi:hypothetical protein